MNRKLTFSLISPVWIALCLLGARGANAVTVAELQEQLAKGEKLTVIDVRSTTLFTKGHIPGAINVPAALCPDKHLPRLGNVVVCGEGLGHDSADIALVSLNAKPGITATELEGGFAAWESAQSVTTREKGMEPEALNYITYSQLKQSGDDTVLVDLRKQPAQQRQAVGATNAPAAKSLTDLGQEFPGKRVSQSPFNLPQARSSKGAATLPPVLVLIDNGDGTAQKTARILKANGVTRYVILAGGEEILARKGQPGLQRNSPVSSVPNQSPSNNRTTK